MKTKQISTYKDLKGVAEQKVTPITLTAEITKCVKVNICNAAEKIEEYPETIQKLVWRALHYKCEIENRRSMVPTSSEHYEKLTKYIEAYRQTQKLILKMCRKQNLRDIIIEEGF